MATWVLSLLNPTSSPFPLEVPVPNKLLAPQTPSQYLLPVNPIGQTPHLTFFSIPFCPGTNIGTGAFCSQQFTYRHSLIYTQRKRFQIIHVLRGKTLYTTCKCIFVLIKNTWKYFMYFKSLITSKPETPCRLFVDITYIYACQKQLSRFFSTLLYEGELLFCKISSKSVNLKKNNLSH